LEIRQSLGAYLQGMLDNKIVDHYRRACLHLRHLDQLIAFFDRAELSPADQLAYKEQESALQGYISGLSGRMRDIFLLSREAGLPHAEISRQLNLSSQTVRNQLSKALKALRDKMVPQDVRASGASEK
jgi:RNA polymerase sigma factor (sigma-70 family)